MADELAKANISVILTGNRGAAANWETVEALPGPPLSRSVASILSEAGVLFALAIDAERMFLSFPPPPPPSLFPSSLVRTGKPAKCAG